MKDIILKVVQKLQAGKTDPKVTLLGQIKGKEKQPRITNRRVWVLKTPNGLINVVCVTKELSGKAKGDLWSVDSEVI